MTAWKRNSQDFTSYHTDTNFLADFRFHATVGDNMAEARGCLLLNCYTQDHESIFDGSSMHACIETVKQRL